jgi:hypothetical protein
MVNEFFFDMDVFNSSGVRVNASKGTEDLPREEEYDAEPFTVDGIHHFCAKGHAPFPQH